MKIWMKLLTKRRALLNLAIPPVLVILLFALASTPAYADTVSNSYDASSEYSETITIDNTEGVVDLGVSSVIVSLSSGTDTADLANNGNNVEGDDGDEDVEGDEADDAADAEADAADAEADAADAEADDAADAADAEADAAADEADAEADAADAEADDAADGGVEDVEPGLIVNDGDGEIWSSPTPLTMDINMPDKLTLAIIISSSGEFLESITVTSADGKLMLRFDKGDKIVGVDSRIPQRLALEVGKPLPPPSDAVIVGLIYELDVYDSEDNSTPLPVIISPPATMVLAYDPEELPENTSSVFIGYYDEEQGWVQLESPDGFVAGVGEAAAEVSHFTPFAVIAKLAAPSPAADCEVDDLAIQPNQDETGEGNFEVTPIPELPEPISPEFVLPEPVAEADGYNGYGWLILVGYVVVAVMVLMFPIVRRQLQMKRLESALDLEAGWCKASCATLDTKPSECIPGVTAVETLTNTRSAPDMFRVSNLNITPEQVKPGEAVTIAAETTLTSHIKSNSSLVLKVKGVAEAVKEVTLRPRQSQKVAFTILKDKPGVYDVDLEGLKGSFTVEG